MTKKSPKKFRKRCSHCLRFKLLDKFGPDPLRSHGRKSYCRACAAEYQRRWAAKHRVKKQLEERVREILSRGKP